MSSVTRHPTSRRQKQGGLSDLVIDLLAFVDELKAPGQKYAQAQQKRLDEKRKALIEAARRIEMKLRALPAEGAVAAQGPLARAHARGADFRAGVLAKPDMWSGEDIARRLAVTRQAVDKKRLAGELFALSWGQRKLLYPAWQAEPGVFEHMKPVLAILRKEDPWTIYRFFTTPEATAGEQTPLDMLRKGKAAEVVRAARAFVDRG